VATFVALLFFFTGVAQDTARINALYNEGQRLIRKPENERVDMDSAYAISQQIATISRNNKYPCGIGISKLLIAKVLNESHRNDGRREVSVEAYDILKTCELPRLQAEALIEIGGTYENSPADLPTKIYYYESAVKIYRKTQDDLSAASMLEFVGDLYNLNNQYQKSLETLQLALTLYKKAHYTRLHGLYSLMGSSYNFLNDFPNALRYNLMAMETGEKLHETGSIMSPIYNRLAMIYNSMEEYQKAYDCFKRGLHIAYLNRDTLSIQSMQINITYILRKMGDYNAALDTLHSLERINLPADDDGKTDVYARYLITYREMNAFDKGMPYYREMAAAYKRGLQYPSVRQSTQLAMASFLQGMGRMEDSRPYLNDFVEEAKKGAPPAGREMTAELLLYRVDSAAGNTAGAMAHYLLFKKWSDTLKSVTKNRQMAMFQIQFETARKDQDIQLLRQKSALQEASLQKEVIFRNVIFAGGCALMIILALTYNRSRIKQRSNLQLQQKQEEINTQNEQLMKLLQEKEWLLREIHHRVKNNLQIVISLLNSQSVYLDNQDAIDAIRNSQHRMYAMSLIHQKLYQTDNLATIDMSWYIRELVAYMKESFPTETTISFNLNISSLELDVAQAVPLGLILNEAVSNAIKYAFKGKPEGRIGISLKHMGHQQWQLCIFDNGTGLPATFDLEGTTSLGMNLMRGLSDQLDATFTVESHEGTILTIVFPAYQKEMI
jgi:two-component sensor histidine kinase